MADSFRLLGAKEIEALLKQLPDRVAKRVTINSLRAGARLVARQARQNVAANPSIDTKMLYNAIGVEERRRSARGTAVIAVGVKRRAAVLVRKGRNKPTKINPANYAHLIEFGTEHSPAEPFLRPAVDEQGQAAIQRITENAGRGIERETRNLAAGKTSFVTGRRIR